jgi:hypothetical protein
MEKLDQTLD